MPRMVIEREGVVPEGEGWEQAQSRVDEDQKWVVGRMDDLSQSRPPYFVEETLTATLTAPDDAGVRRYVVRAVMNTEKGHRLAKA